MSLLRHTFLQSLRSTLSALLPCACQLCGQESNLLVCSACQARYLSRQIPRCQQCALPLPPNAGTTHCGDCLQHAPAFDQTIVACDYAAPQDQLVLALKFGHQLALAPLFADLLCRTIIAQPTPTLPDLLCAVPLGARRLADRGFNQATEIARPLSRQLGIPLQRQLLKRIRETSQQSSLAPDARVRNVKQAFSLDEAALESVQGAHIGVVDDVITTGMTLHEIATMLKRFGARKVTNYVFARTPPHFQ